MTIQRSLPFAVTFILVSLGSTCSLAADIKTPEQTAHWMVLIQSRSYPGWRKELLEKDGSSEACVTRNFARDSRWDTFFVDDKSQAQLPGLFVANGHIYDLRKTTVTRTKNNLIGYKIESTVTELSSVQLATRSTKRLLGERQWNDSKGYAIEQNENGPTEDSDKPKDRIIFKYEGENSVIAVFGPYISVLETSSTQSFGTTHPYSNRSWQIYKLTPSGLKTGTVPIPRSVTAQIRAGFKKLFYDLPGAHNDDSGQAISPAGGTAMIETLYALERTSQGVVLVKLPQAIPASYEKIKNEFISKNKALIDWNKAKVFTIAPDQSAVVYVSGDKLYWRSVSATQPRLIGTVVDVRGWQWADTNALTDTERKKLGIGNKNPGAAGAAPLR